MEISYFGKENQYSSFPPKRKKFAIDVQVVKEVDRPTWKVKQRRTRRFNLRRVETFDLILLQNMDQKLFAPFL